MHFNSISSRRTDLLFNIGYALTRQIVGISFFRIIKYSEVFVNKHDRRNSNISKYDLQPAIIHYNLSSERSQI